MKKILVLVLFVPILAFGRIIPKTTNEHNPGIGANSLIHYQYNSREEDKTSFDLQEIYLIFGGDIPPIFNSMIYLSIAQKEDGTFKIDPTTAIVRTTTWESVTLAGGRWFLDIGQHNPYFTFQFPFITQPEIITEIFGPNALIGIGFGVDWILPTSWHSVFLAEFTDAKNTVFFEGEKQETIGDLRWENTFEFTDANKLDFALSYGRAEGKINVWAADFKYTWYPQNLDRKVFEWVGEYLAKDKNRKVAGFYSHLKSEVWKNFWFQYRFEYVGLEPDRVNPITRKHVGLFAWVPSDKLALRLQFDTKDDGQEKNEETVQFQMNIGIGAFSENTY